MRIDGPVAPTVKSGAKNIDTKALLHYVTQLCQRHWPAALNKLQGKQPAAPTPANKYAWVVEGIEDMASIGEEFEELVTKARRLNERRDLSAKQSKELATTLANAEAAAAYGKKLAKRVKTTEAEMVVSGQRHVDKLLAKVDKLAVRPEETRKFRATIEKAKGMTAALGRFRTRVANSSAWLESAADSIASVRANRAPKQQHPERSNDSGCAKSDEAFLRLIA